ncbi:MAG TPA: nickel-dependent hydrogenase large subunit [Symbiobacteriaceae bacterium]|nr:nickel-dependent hydrogenase large subunit [Symbiobacteriaceae bacterium]
MSRRIVINPVTRISGFMEIDVTLDAGAVVDAKTRGSFFRGFEQIMVGRNPFDAIYLTQRICGICSSAHSVASAVALESALGVQVTEQGRYLRDIIHGCEYLQNHIRHFYQYTLPDYVRLPAVSGAFVADHGDYRLPGALNEELAAHYFAALPVSRLAHQMLAVMGGKAPHNHGVFVGGVSRSPTVDQIVTMKSLLQEITAFISETMVPDAQALGRYYEDYFAMGRGPGNLLSYGAFDRYGQLGTLYVDPLVSLNGRVEPFRPERITEAIDYAWYQGKRSYTPFETISEPDLHKEGAYSWVKAPRYDGVPCEVGPLARLWLCGEYRNGISAMDRTIARALEARKIAGILATLLDHVRPGLHLQQEWQLPDKAMGAGLVDTTRGALGHWLKIENRVLSFYQIITPSAWDFSTRDARQYGTAEQSLLGTQVRNPDQPVELGRILRSFDPCMSCATHVYSPGREPVTIQVMG